MSDRRNDLAVQACLGAATAATAVAALAQLVGRDNARVIAKVLLAPRRKHTRVEVRADDRFVLHYFHPRPDDYPPLEGLAPAHGDGAPGSTRQQVKWRHDIERDRRVARRRLEDFLARTTLRGGQPAAIAQRNAEIAYAAVRDGRSDAAIAAAHPPLTAKTVSNLVSSAGSCLAGRMP